jgi:hypothetical protein
MLMMKTNYNNNSNTKLNLNSRPLSGKGSGGNILAPYVYVPPEANINDN